MPRSLLPCAVWVLLLTLAPFAWADSVHGRWQLIEINGEHVEQAPVLVLNHDGRMWGAASCNGSVGQFEQRGSELAFIDNEMTLLGCRLPPQVAAQHDAFLRMLVGTVSVRSAEQNLLVLVAPDGREMTLRRQPE